MNHKIRDLGFIVSLVIIIFIGSYLTYEKLQTGTLDDYLMMLGEKLIVMVPEGEQREKAAEHLGQFLRQVRNREVEPERVEAFAANVLNLTQGDTVLSPEAVSRSFYSLTTDIETPEIAVPDDGGVQDSYVVVSTIERPAKTVRITGKEDWKNLTIRLEALMKFEKALSKYQVEMQKYEKVKFNTEEGLKVVLNQDIKQMISKKEFEKINEDIKALSEMKLLIWEEKLKNAEIDKISVEADLASRAHQLALDSLRTMKIQIKIQHDSVSGKEIISR